MFPEHSEPREDAKLASSLGRSKDVTLGYFLRAGGQQGQLEDVRPLPEFANNSRLASIGLRYNYANEV